MNSSPQQLPTFDELQAKLTPLWRSIQSMNQDEQTIVVVPSLTLEALSGPALGSIMQPYEERFLFLLLLLRQPRARLIYVTSQAINPSIIDYYLDLLPGVIPSHARKRLFLVSPLDGSARPLSAKLLERPRLLEKIRSLIPDPERAHLVPYNTTELERDLAIQLGIPMYGADPKFFHWGTKTGCRRLFSEEGLPHPIGIEDLWSIKDVVSAIQKLRAEKLSIQKVLVKLNEGVSGEGNSLVLLSGLSAPGSPDETDSVEKRVMEMKMEDPNQSVEGYIAALAKHGGVVEELIEGEEVRSPSVQLRVTPLGDLEVLSTHDQLLGGPGGQSYIGCRFPANDEYATEITKHAEKVGKRLAKEGVIGRFALDFIVVKKTDGWDAYAIEVNLRKGGTTHPFLTLQFLTDGAYSPETAIFKAPDGRQKFFVATDHLASESFRGLTPDDLFDIVVRHRMHFDQSRQTGVVFHMMSGLSEHGFTGLTAVADSHEAADRMYKDAVSVLETEATEAFVTRP